MVDSADIVSLTKAQLGKPYVFGDEGPNTFDCSGLVQYVFGRLGISLPRLSSEQARHGVPVEAGSERPGDLVFSSWDGRRSSHVGIYVGGGKIINAPQPGERVSYATLTPYYRQRVDAIRRIPGVDGGTAPAGGSPSVGGILSGVTPFQEAVKGLSDGVAGIAESVAGVGRVAEMLTKLALPSTWVRGVSGVLGIGFILAGCLFLIREVRAGG